MTLCPIAIAVGCKKCPAFSVCPVKTVIGASIRYGKHRPQVYDFIRRNAQVKACYQALLARGKKPKQAVIAIMRKLLHAIWGILHHQQPFNPSLFYQPKTT